MSEGMQVSALGSARSPGAMGKSWSTRLRWRGRLLVGAAGLSPLARSALRSIAPLLLGGCVGSADLFPSTRELGASPRRPFEGIGGEADGGPGVVPMQDVPPPPVLEPPVQEDDSRGGSSDDPGVVAPVDAGGVPAEEQEPPVALSCVFDPPELVVGLGLDIELWASTVSPDGRTLVLSGNVGQDNEDLFRSQRLVQSPENGDLGPVFQPAQAIMELSTSAAEGGPFLTADGLALYFFSTRAGGQGGRDLWVATRPQVSAQWAAPTPVVELNTPYDDHLITLSVDGLRAIWVSDRSGQSDLWAASRTATNLPFSTPYPVTELNSSAEEGRAQLTADELGVVFASERPGGIGEMDLWWANRPDRASAFGEPVNLSALNSPEFDLDPVLGPGDSELFFASNRAGGGELFRAARRCEPTLVR